MTEQFHILGAAHNKYLYNLPMLAMSKVPDLLQEHTPGSEHYQTTFLRAKLSFTPFFFLAENSELNEMMVVALRKPFKIYQYSTGIYLT